jgi:hypothetical protein
MTTRIASVLCSISVAEEKCEFIIRFVIVGMRIRSLRTPRAGRHHIVAAPGFNHGLWCARPVRAKDAREGKSPDAGPGRPGRRTRAHAADGRREALRIRGTPGQGESARPVRRPPAADRLSRILRAPGVHGWPEHACVGCSLGADQVGNLAHLNARDTTLAYATRAPQADIARLKARMGWEMPWYTITDSFDAGTATTPSSAMATGWSARTSSIAAVTRRWGASGASST